jgi:ATP adenylyltransferase
MAHAALFAPWRMDYIKSLTKPAGDRCFLCDAAAASDQNQAREALVLWQTAHSVVLLNRYPYTNGHLLVAPRAHKADLEELSAKEKADLLEQTTEAVALLRRAVSAQGFNIGINLGRCAGAGVPGHLHQHVVPRWAGDVNFMSVVGEVQVVPEAVTQLYNELLDVREKMKSSPAPAVSDH